jgi:hypothetical protein
MEWDKEATSIACLSTYLFDISITYPLQQLLPSYQKIALGLLVPRNLIPI